MYFFLLVFIPNLEQIDILIIPTLLMQDHVTKISLILLVNVQQMADRFQYVLNSKNIQSSLKNMATI